MPTWIIGIIGCLAQGPQCVGYCLGLAEGTVPEETLREGRQTEWETGEPDKACVEGHRARRVHRRHHRALCWETGSWMDKAGGHRTVEGMGACHIPWGLQSGSSGLARVHSLQDEGDDRGRHQKENCQDIAEDPDGDRHG